MTENESVNTGFDKLYNAAKASDYTLVAGVSMQGFSFCIFDHALKRFLAAGSDLFDSKGNGQQISDKIRSLIARHPELVMEYGKRILLFESERSTLIPWPLFDENSAELYHQFNHMPGEDEELFVNRLINPEACNVFMLPSGLAAAMNESFGRMEVKHHSGALVQGLLTRFKNVPGRAVTVLNVRQSAFDIIVIENQKLQLYNSFTYRTAEDFIYFVLFVFEQMKLNPETDAVLLSGSIAKSSRLYELLYRYIRNVDFIERPEAAEYSYVFDDIPKHYYYHLYQAALCEL